MNFTSATRSGPGFGRTEFRRIAISIAVLAAALLAFGVFTASAGAGEYTVSSCRSDVGAPLENAAWKLDIDDAFEGLTATDTCAADGSLELALTPPELTHAYGAYKFSAPEGTSIVDYELLRSLEVAPSVWPPEFYFAAFVRERSDGGEVENYGCTSFGGDCVSVGDPNDPYAPANAFSQQAPNLQSIELWVGCGYLFCEPPGGLAARARLFRSNVTISDDKAPSVATASGTLLSDPASGTATLRLGANDVGGGVAAATASIDDGELRTWSASDSFVSCRPPYTAPQPCPPEAEISLAFDTTKLSDGAHQLSGTLTDVAGNTAEFGPVAIIVQNPTPAPPVLAQSTGNGTPAVTTPVLTLNASSMIRARRTKTAVSGTLRTQSGAPIAGASLAVNSVQLATDELQEQALPDVVTSGDGSFSVPIQTDGAQLLRVSFSPSPGAAVTAAASVAVRTRTDLSLKPTKAKLKRGGNMTLKGKLLGAGPAARGSTVSIQAIVRGKWRPVGSATVRKDGSFKWSYKFVALTSTTVFSFRAVVAKNPGWPWPTISSKRVKVKVAA